MIWGNDYPHFEGSWPNSPQAVEAQIQRVGLSDQETTAIFGGTLAELLGIEDVVAATAS
jgi:hypothetical protein